MKKVEKIANYVYIIIFLSFLLIPIIMTNTEKDTVSDIDNRKLVEFPEIGDIEYSSKIESYLQDRIGLREEMLSAYAVLNDKVVGELVHPGYTYGKEGYVFFHMHDNIQYNSYHQAFAEAVLKMQKYCESRGAKFYFLFDPEKISVYRRYLPAGVNYNDEWVDNMLNYMEELGINCISNKEILTALSYDEQVFNRQYDAGHWNDLGAFYGINNLWKTVHKDFPNITEYSKDDFNITTKIEKYYPVSKIPVNEEVPVFTLKTEWKNLRHRYSGMRQNKQYPFFLYYVNQEEDAEKYPKALIFQGSYYNRCPEFFVGRLKEYIGIHAYQNVLDLDYYFNIFQPELVVFEGAEYTYTNGYYDFNKMTALDYNPGLFGEGNDVKEAIDKAKTQAEEIKSRNMSINIISGTGFDTVYFKDDLSNAKYVYLFTENHVFDMKKDSYGIYNAAIPPDTIKETATLYYEDFEGEKYYSKLTTKKVQQFVKNVVHTPGVSYSEINNQYIFETSLKDNIFNSVNIQLINGVTGEYCGQIMSTSTTGIYTSSYFHDNETGWYRVRLKANSNLQDESIDVLAYLEKGEIYFYSFNLNSFDNRRVVIENYELLGTSSWGAEEQ